MTNTGHHCLRKTLIVFLFAAAWRPSAQADTVRPACLAGSWGTAESLYAGSAGQAQRQLAADVAKMIAELRLQAAQQQGQP